MASVKRKTYVKYVGLLIHNNRKLKACNIFEPLTATQWSFILHGQDNGLSQIFQLIVSTSEKRLDNINVVEWRQVS